VSIAVPPQVTGVERSGRTDELGIDVTITAAQPRLGDDGPDAVALRLATLDQAFPRVQDLALVPGVCESFTRMKGCQGRPPSVASPPWLAK
jgi:hypothetical protein